jgi:hypothetical protein
MGLRLDQKSEILHAEVVVMTKSADSLGRKLIKITHADEITLAASRSECLMDADNGGNILTLGRHSIPLLNGRSVALRVISNIETREVRSRFNSHSEFA